MTLSLRAGAAWYGIATAVDRALALLLLPLLTRALGAADYGVWTQTLSGAALALPLVTWALPTAIVRSFASPAAAPWLRRQFARLFAVVALALLACAAGVLFAAAPVSLAVYGDAQRQGLLPALLGLVAADAVVDFALAWLRAGGRMAVIAAVLLVRSGARYALVWLLLGFSAGSGIEGWLGSYAALQVLLALGVLALGATRLPAAASPVPPVATSCSVPALLGFATPLVLLALFTAVNASFDRFLLVQLLGLGGVAVYAAAASLCNVVAVFHGVLGFSLFPVLARHWAEGRHDAAARLTDQALQAYLFLCLPVSLAIALGGRALLPLLTTAAFDAPPAVFALLGLAAAAFGLYQILLYALLLAGRSRQVLALALAAAAVNAALNLLLAPRLHAVGAALAAALSNALMVALAARLARGVMRWTFPWAALWPIIRRAIAAALPLAAAMALAPGGWAAPLAALASGAVLYLVLDLRGAAPVTRLLLPRRVPS